MALVKRVMKVGNSAGLTFDQTIMKQMGWEIGTSVEVRVSGEDLVLSPHRYATDEEAKAAGKRVVSQRKALLDRLAK